MIHRPQAAPASAEPTAPPSSVPPAATPPPQAPAMPAPGAQNAQPPATQATQLPVPQLQDIHQPAPVGFWPPAPGWWLLAALLAAGAVALLRSLHRRRRGNAYRRAAQTELLAAWQAYQHSGDATAYLKQLNQILKRAALAAFPRQEVASLTGEAWLAFLDRGLAAASGKPDRFCSEQGRLLLTAPYRPSNPTEAETLALHDLGLAWLQQPKRHDNSAQEVEHAAP